MTRQYYSSRKGPKKLSLAELYNKSVHLYLYFRDKDYFKEKTGISDRNVPDSFIHEARLLLDFDPLPFEDWKPDKVTEDNVFDTVEFLHDHASLPGELIHVSDNTGYDYWDYEDYDTEAGQAEFRTKASGFLSRYRDGYELAHDGKILSLGMDGTESIVKAKLLSLGDDNIDRKVQESIRKWRNRALSVEQRKQAVRDLIDVFEWLRESGVLKTTLAQKDESALFEIANKFALRHHNPRQRQDYDESIWYSWMFHFYLSTYHAVSRMIIRANQINREEQE